MKKLVLVEEGKKEIIGQFATFKDLKMFLVQNTKMYFGWINDNVSDPDDYRELPNFISCEDARDVQTILNDYDYAWWSIVVD